MTNIKRQASKEQIATGIAAITIDGFEIPNVFSSNFYIERPALFQVQEDSSLKLIHREAVSLVSARIKSRDIGGKGYRKVREYAESSFLDPLPVHLEFDTWGEHFSADMMACFEIDSETHQQRGICEIQMSLRFVTSLVENDDYLSPVQAGSKVSCLLSHP